MSKTLAFAATAAVVVGFIVPRPTLAQPAVQNEILDKGQGSQQVVNDAARTVLAIKADGSFGEMLKFAKGVLIMPNVVRGAFVVGGEGAEGVLLKHESDGAWSGPAFLTIDLTSLGVQQEGKTAPAAMILMTDKALNSFTHASHFSLSGSQGLLIANFSSQTLAPIGNYANRGPTPIGGGDIMIWTDQSGFFAKADARGAKMSQDLVEDRAYYGKPVDVREILHGEVNNPHADLLKSRLPA